MTNENQHWRGEPDRRANRSKLRSRLIPAILAMVVVAILGSMFGLFSIVSREPEPFLLPIWVTQLSNVDSGLHGPLEMDRRAISVDRLFKDRSVNLVQSPQRQLIRNELGKLRTRKTHQPVVVYISARAAIAEDNDVFLILDDSSIENVNERLYLSQVLSLIGECSSQNKLLVLDINWPFALPEKGYFRDDVSSCIQQAIAKNHDANLRVLSSCSPGQVAWTILEPRRSVFGYFFEQALHGAADGFCDGVSDGRVSVNELAAYVATSVDNYSAHACPRRQSPCMYGASPDFDLMACSRLSDLTARQTPAEKNAAYPNWLSAAWSARDEKIDARVYRLNPWLMQRYESTILNAEMSWRNGNNPKRIESKLLASLTTLENEIDAYRRALINPMGGEKIASFNKHFRLPSDGSGDANSKLVSDPVIETSKQGGETSKVSKKTAQAKTKAAPKGAEKDKEKPLPVADPNVLVRNLMADVNAQYEITPEPQLPAALKKLTDGFLKTTQAVSNEKLVTALFGFVSSNPKFEARHLKTIGKIIDSRSLAQESYQSLILVEMVRRESIKNELDWSQATTQKTLQLIASNETCNGFPRAWPWLQDMIEKASDQRAVVETLFWHKDYVSQNAFAQRLSEAWKLQSRLAIFQQRLENSSSMLEQAYWRLPQCLRLIEFNSTQSLRWMQGIKSAADLDDILDDDPAVVQQTSPLETSHEDSILESKLETAFAESQDLRASLQSLLQPFTAQEIQLELKRAQSPDAGIQELLKLTEALSSPFVDSITRVKISNAANLLSKRLHHEALEDLPGTVKSPLTAEQIEALAEKASQRTEHRVSFVVGLSELGKKVVASNGAASPGDVAGRIDTDSRVEHVHAVKKRSQPIAEFAAYQNDELFKQFKLAKQLELARHQWAYAALLYAKLSKDSPYSNYYVGLAQRYRNAAGNSDSLEVTIASTSTNNLLGASHPSLKLTIPFFKARLTKPNGSKFKLASFGSKNVVTASVIPPVSSALTVSEVQSLRDQSIHMDVKIDVDAERDELAKIAGFFVEVKSENQTLLHRVDLPGLANGPTVDVFFRKIGGDQYSRKTSVQLRPSKIDQAYTLFVQNLVDREQEVTVAFGGSTANVKLRPKETKQVKFVGKPPKPNERLPQVHSPMSVVATDTKTEVRLLVKPVSIDIAAPREYVEIVSAQYTPFDSGGNRLEVWLRATNLPGGSPCIAELKMNSKMIPSLNSVQGGKFLAELPSNGKPTLLYAENLQLNEIQNERGQFEIAVDGVPRVFVLEALFARQGPASTPQLMLEPSAGIIASKVGLAGPEFSVRIPTTNAPRGARLNISLQKPGPGSNQSDLEVALPSPTKEYIGFCADEKGRLLFRAEVSDWEIKLDTTGLVGRRDLSVEMTLDNQAIARDVLSLSLDNTHPDSLRFVQPPERVAVNQQIEIRTTAVSPLTGIVSMQVFVGEMEDGNVPKKAKLVEATRRQNNPEIWDSKIKMPAAVGDVVLTAIATNGAGLTSFETREMSVVPANQLNVGRIQGQVFEGVRYQPAVDVALFALDNKLVAKTTTKFDGTFSFESVAAGKYLIKSIKESTGRVGAISVEVRPGQTSGGDISLTL